MKTKQIMNWLGLYFLLTTAGLGAYILLFKETPLLPLDAKEATSTFQIIIPVFVAQLVLIFKWFGNNDLKEDEYVNIPAWVIKAPPTIVIVLIGLAIIDLALGNAMENSSWSLSPTDFRTIVTFCVTILNSTTIYIVSRFFKS